LRRTYPQAGELYAQIRPLNDPALVTGVLRGTVQLSPTSALSS